MISLRHLLAAVTLLFSLAATAQTQPLLESNELQQMLEQVQTIDIRSPDAYAAGHIPNAISAPYGRWRGPASNPGKLHDDATFGKLIQELGLTPEQHLVVYSTGDDETDFGAAARVYWTLKYLGFEKLSLLNGGYKYWQAQKNPVSHSAHQLPASSSLVRPQPQLAILQDELYSKLSQKQQGFQLLDSRPAAFFQGQVKAPTATTPGTIAGAQNVPFQQWFLQGETRVRPAAEIKQLIATQQLDQASETLSFCNTGHWAATNWFVMSELAELPNVRLYPGSMADWTQSKLALPMDNEPSRWQQITNKFKQLAK